VYAQRTFGPNLKNDVGGGVRSIFPLACTSSCMGQAVPFFGCRCIPAPYPLHVHHQKLSSATHRISRQSNTAHLAHLRAYVNYARTKLPWLTVSASKPCTAAWNTMVRRRSGRLLRRCVAIKTNAQQTLTASSRQTGLLAIVACPRLSFTLLTPICLVRPFAINL
jgi:hypothetical protein